jgi:hypothetical protein
LLVGFVVLRFANIVAGILLPLSLASKDAHALGPVEVEVALKAGAGTRVNDFKPDAPNPHGGPLGAGIGARAGVSLYEFYGGVSGLYYLGTEQYSAPTTLSAHSVVYGIEAGYGVTLLDHLVLRAQLGIGNQTTSSTSSTPGIADVHSTDSYVYLEPGVTGLFVIGTFFVGADANVYLLPHVSHAAPEAGTTSSFGTGFTFHGQAGVRF